MKHLLATVLILLVIGGLVLVRTISLDRDSPVPVAPKPGVHIVKQLLLPGSVPFQTLFWNTMESEQTRVVVVNDLLVWSNLWLNSTDCEVTGTCQSPPYVDFDSRTVLIVDAGLEGSAGYSINVTSIVADHTHVSVNAILTTPGANCVEAAVLTFPSQVVEIDQTNLFFTLNMTDDQGPACPI